MKSIYFENETRKLSFRAKATTALSYGLTKTSPYLSFKFALKILCNPSSRRNYDLRTKIKPENFKVETSMGSINLYKFKPTESLDNNIFLSHGWADSTTRFTQLIDHLTSKGHTVWSLDHIGHGKSFGNTAHLFGFIEGITESLNYMKAQNATPTTLIGHSMGSLGLLNLSEAFLKEKKLIFISAPVKFFENMYERITGFGLSEVMITNFLDRLALKKNIKWADLSPHLHKNKFTEDTLIIHDDTDQICSWPNMKELTSDRPNKEFITTGLGHLKILKEPAVLNTVSDFIS